jgi:hypothetical protein
MSTAVPLYPHRVTQQVELTLSEFDDPLSDESVRVSGPPEGQAGAEAMGPRVYSLASAVDTWKRLSFKIEARLPPAQLEWVLPPGVKPSQATRLIALLTCPTTKVRRGIQLKYSPSGIWRGEAIISRGDVAHRVFLLPQLLLTVDLDGSKNGTFASKRAALIGTGERVRIELKPSAASFISSVEVYWEDFESSQNQWRRAHADDVFHLSIEEGPVVYLNSRYHELRDILESTAKRGPQAAQRELTAALIAHPVLVQLSSIALLAVEFDEISQTASAPGGWRGELLETLLPELYPGLPSIEAGIRRVAEDTRDSFALAEVLSRLGTCVQRMISTHQAIETAIRAFEATRNERESDAD